VIAGGNRANTLHYVNNNQLIKVLGHTRVVVVGLHMRVQSGNELGECYQRAGIVPLTEMMNICVSFLAGWGDGAPRRRL